MFTVDELRQKTEAYQRNAMSLKDFEEWFEDNSIDADDDAELTELRIAIDAAFAEYHFDRIGEAALREELVAAVRPFAPRWERLANLFLLKNESTSSECMRDATPRAMVVASAKTDVVRKPSPAPPERNVAASANCSLVRAAAAVPA